ncbi:protein CTLA-2-alpha [Mus caroli]|uniref:Protein CTLA-2-alpha n=1 Tax=Mus caroli TaxID=10089 RepID=A0A6P5QNK1_MUSCR|nr:protein CTLA-2-alpha [Mus caroli]
MASICEQKLQHFSAVFLLILCLGMMSAAPSSDPSLDNEWEEWKTKFAKTYSLDEERHRRLVWEENKKKIEAHNADYEKGKTSFSMSLNQFSDLTSEEFRTNCNRNSMYRGEMAPDLPKYEDLGKNGYLTPGRDQPE